VRCVGASLRGVSRRLRSHPAARLRAFRCGDLRPSMHLGDPLHFYHPRLIRERQMDWFRDHLYDPDLDEASPLSLFP
jgi:hypothetical protein